MEDFERRLIEEHNELASKMTKLDGFLASEAFNGLSALNRSLLICQKSAMKTYELILNQRIIALELNCSV